MRTLITTDFHFGLSRKAHFTAESSARREAVSKGTLKHVLETPHDVAVCVGDFFDRFSNPETVILQTVPLAQRFDVILAGNHDVSNREGVEGSLSVLAEILDGTETQFARGDTVWARFGHMTAAFVPHQLTQEAFEEALQAACEAASSGSGWRILFLHCNVLSPFADNLASLNLTEAMAHQALQAFHHVVVGHEHNPRQLFDDRLWVVGSHFPTAFDQLTDHRHLVFDDATGRMESIVHWRADEHVFVGPDSLAPQGRQFYDLTECQDPRAPLRLFKQGALGVRLARSEHEEHARQSIAQIKSLPEQVRKLLQEDPELLRLWDQIIQSLGDPS